MTIKLRARLLGNVAGSDGDSLDSTLPTSLRHIDGILGEDDWIIVGEGHRSAAESVRCQCDLLRRCPIRQLVPFARLGNLPVLAKATRSEERRVGKECRSREPASDG